MDTTTGRPEETGDGTRACTQSDESEDWSIQLARVNDRKEPESTAGG